MSRTRIVAKNIVVRSASQVANIILSTLFVMYITRKLGTADFGKYTAAFSLASLLAIAVTELGIHTLLTKEIAREKDNSRLFLGNVIIIKLVLSLFFFASLYMAINILNYSDEVVYVVCAMGVFSLTASFFELFNSVFRGYERMEYEAAVMFLNRVVVVTSGGTALFMGYNLKVFVTVMALSNLVSFIPAIALSFKRFLVPQFKVDIYLIKTIFKEALPIGLILLFTTLNLKFGVVLLSFLKNYSAAGWYGAPLRLIESLIVFPLFLTTALLPVFSSLHQSGDKAINKWYEGSFRLLIIVGIPVALWVNLAADKIVLLLFGAEYANSAVVLQLLAAALFFLAINMLFSYILIAVDKQMLNIISFGVGSIATVALSLVLVPYLSYIGAGISFLAGQVIIFITSFSLIHKNCYKLPILRVTVKPLLSGVMTGILIFYIREWNIAIVSLLGISLYIGFLVFFRAVQPEDLELLKNTFRTKKRA